MADLLSDEDIISSPQSLPQSSGANLMSDDEVLAPDTSSVKPKSSNQLPQLPVSDKDGVVSRLLKGTANTVAPYFIDRQSNMPVGNQIEDVAKSAGSSLANTAMGAITVPIDIAHNTGELVGNKIGKAITGFDTQPDYTNYTGDAEKALGTDYEPKTALGNRASLATGIATPLIGSKALGLAKDGIEAAQAPKPAPHDPIKAMNAISDSFNGAIDKANTFYNFPRQLAEGQSVSAPQVKDHLASVINDVNEQPYHEAKAQVGTLQKIHDSLPDDGTVPVTDLMDLRKFTNKFFNPARMTDKGSTYGALNAKVDSGLNVAREQVPNFGNALNIADNYWANNVSQPYLKNKVLQKAWSPEDAHNLRMVNEGQLDEPGDLTTQRANNLVNSVKDVPTYNAIRRTLPDDVGASFDAAVLKNTAPNRIGAFIGTAKSAAELNPLQTAKGVAQVVNPTIPTNIKAVRAAIKSQDTYTPLAAKNAASQSKYEDLVKGNMTGKGRPLSLPPADIDVPPEGFGPQDSGSEPQKLLPRGGSDTYYQPQGRALTYQPRADFEVSPDGFVQKPSDVSRGRTSAADKAPIARAGQETNDRNIKRLMITHQPGADVIGTRTGMNDVTKGVIPSPYTLGESSGMPIRSDAELQAVLKNPNVIDQSRGGAINKAKGGAVFPRPKYYPALEKRKQNA